MNGDIRGISHRFFGRWGRRHGRYSLPLDRYFSEVLHEIESKPPANWAGEGVPCMVRGEDDKFIDYCIPTEPKSMFSVFEKSVPEPAGEKDPKKIYDWMNTSHPGAHLHRKLAEKVAFRIHGEISGAHP